MELFETPVLFLIFNRPDLTETVFRRIREVRPKYLYVAADGPRPTHPEDADKCKQSRQVVMDMIDWDCEIKTLFRDENLGCGRAVSGAITWFFEHVDEGIILEDDCLPDLSFFRFCEELLVKYKSHGTVMHISGNNFQNPNHKEKNSYYFSAYNHNWGWATWRNAWKLYSFELANFSEEKLTKLLKQYKFSQKEINFWHTRIDPVSRKSIDTWDYQWMYTIWENRGLCILPHINLVKNIGFRQDATHTKKANNSITEIQALNIRFPLSHPSRIAINRKADLASYFQHFGGTILSDRYLKVLKKLFYDVYQKFKWFYFSYIYFRYKSHTMIPKHTYINNLKLVNKHKVSGVVVECGTWKGGMIAGITHVLGNDREYHLFDSFEGLPESAPIDGDKAKDWQSKKDGKYYFDNCKASVSDANEVMLRSNVKSYKIHKGWFKETLNDFDPKGGIAVLRLDADWYESTMDCLRCLFPKVNRKGLIIIDDYYMWEGCSKAVHDFLSETKSSCRINSFKNVCFIIKN